MNVWLYNYINVWVFVSKPTTWAVPAGAGDISNNAAVRFELVVVSPYAIFYSIFYFVYPAMPAGAYERNSQLAPGCVPCSQPTR